MDVTARFYRPSATATAVFVLAVDRNQPALLGLARSLLGFAERLRVSITLAVDTMPGRELVAEFLASGVDCELAMWGRRGWTTRSRPDTFVAEFSGRRQQWTRYGLLPRTLVCEGDGYYAVGDRLAHLGLRTICHAARLARPGRLAPRTLGYGIVEMPVTHRAQPRQAWWRRSHADQLQQSSEAGTDTRWVVRLSRIDGNMLALRELRNLIAMAGSLERRGHLNTRPVTPGFANSAAA